MLLLLLLNIQPDADAGANAEGSGHDREAAAPEPHQPRRAQYHSALPSICPTWTAVELPRGKCSPGTGYT
jgi:hypothetical protein